MRTREEDLRTARRALHLDDIGSQRIAVVVFLRRHLLRRHEQRLGTPDIDKDIPSLNALDDPCHNV